MVSIEKEALLKNVESVTTKLNDKIDTLANTLAKFMETFKTYTDKADQRLVSLEKMAANPAGAGAPQSLSADKPAVTASVPSITSRAKVRPVKARNLAEITSRDAHNLSSQNGR